MGKQDWWRPPRPLLALLLACSLASAAALGWAGWTLIRQERAAEAHELQRRVEVEAGRLPALLRESLSSLEARLVEWLIRPPEGSLPPAASLLLLVEGESTQAFPRGRLLYSPTAQRHDEPPAQTWSEAESLEFAKQDPQGAAALYARMADSPDAGVRAGALLRLGRVLNNLGRHDAALDAYRRLARLGDVHVAGAPAAMVAGTALSQILAALGRQSDSRAEAARLRDALQSGQWALSRGQFAFYWSEAARLLGVPGTMPAAAALSEAAAEIRLRLREEENPQGTLTIWTGGQPWFALWKRSQQKVAVLIAEPAALLKPHQSGSPFRIQLLDNEGRSVAGGPNAGPVATVRMAAQTSLPWSVSVSASPSGPSRAAGREQFLLTVLAAAIGSIALATWLMARLIRREAAVARLQSDFVSAVSHEFRSPLTAMRHLSELLALGRVPDSGRRQQYYETLIKETGRLQRLVETLLNFGRMEAGKQPYRFERLDAAAVVGKVAAEFEPVIAPEGRGIAVQESGSHFVEADSDALSLALRNLIDNALKYSPGQPLIWVECGGDGQRVAIRVRDQGVGIGAREQRTIFRKFVRGSAAGEVSASGTGVGLAMVDHIVRAHGGRIELESAPGQGSTFTVLLPAARSL